MSSVEQVREQIIQGQLLPADRLDAQIAQWRASGGDGDSDSLISFLVEQRLLTDFQGEALAAGIAGPYMLGPYRVEAQVATGHLGNVFRAVHVEFNQPVSLKVFPRSIQNDPDKLAFMQREARVSIQLDHPHVIRTFQIGYTGHIYYLAFEDLQGESLETRLKRTGRLPYPEACRLIRQVALALEHLHGADILHRDLRPANLWIFPNGVVKVMEFSVARDALGYLDSIRDEGSHGPGTAGTAAAFQYMAPEQAQDILSADERSDIYSLGCVLYHCLTGRPPFTEQNPVRQIMSHLNDQPQMVNWLVPDLPQPLADLVAVMLSKSPAQWKQTAAAVDWALQPFIEEGKLDLNLAAADWNPDYLEWVRSVSPNTAPEGVLDTNETHSALAPEVADFLDWVTEKAIQRPQRF